MTICCSSTERIPEHFAKILLTTIRIPNWYVQVFEILSHAANVNIFYIYILYIYIYLNIGKANIFADVAVSMMMMVMVFVVVVVVVESCLSR